MSDITKENDNVLAFPGAPEGLNGNEAADAFEKAVLNDPHAEKLQLEVQHLFAPGLYYRQLFVPAGVVVCGHEHKKEHLNLLMAGVALVSTEKGPILVRAPLAFTSLPGVRKLVFAMTDLVWANVHATDETNISVIEEEHVRSSEMFDRHEIETLVAEAKRILESQSE